MFKRLSNLFGGENSSNNQQTEPHVIKGRYQIIKALSSGGMGDTYLAVDLDIPVTPKPKCVIKKLQPQSKNNPDIVRLFKQEAQFLYQLGQEQEQIPQLYAYFIEDDDFYLVQGFIDGHDLTTEIDYVEYKPSQSSESGIAPTILVRKQWAEKAVINLLKEVLILLVYIHEQGVIHRDIKPANLMRCHSTRKLHLIDFGSVKAVSNQIINAQGKTQLTVCIGTPGYMPSEQASGRPNFSSDLYALGITAIQALTGIRPDSLPRERNEIKWRNFATVSDELATFLDKMIHYDCYQRYQSSSEALEVLEEIPIREPKLVKLNGKYFLISQQEVIIPCQFDDSSSLLEEMFIQLKQKHKLTNLRFKKDLHYTDFYSFHDELAKVKKNSKWGYISTQGELVISYQFAQARFFQEGLAAVEKDGKWGYINTQGESVTPYQFDEACSFQEGLAKVNKNNKWGYINTQGELVISYQFAQARFFQEGLAEVEKNGKWGYINTQGKLVVPCQFDNLKIFQEGLAAVEKDGKWGYINTQGELVIPFQFDNVLWFQEGLGVVEKDGKWGYINTQGELVITCQFDDLGLFQEGLAAVEKDGKWGYINTQSNLVIPFQFDDVSSFSEGLAQVKKEGKCGYINTQGKLVIPFQFNDAWDFEEGLTKVKINETEYLIDQEGKIVY